MSFFERVNPKQFIMNSCFNLLKLEIDNTNLELILQKLKNCNNTIKYITTINITNAKLSNFDVNLLLSVFTNLKTINTSSKTYISTSSASEKVKINIF